MKLTNRGFIEVLCVCVAYSTGIACALSLYCNMQKEHMLMTHWGTLNHGKIAVHRQLSEVLVTSYTLCHGVSTINLE